MKAQKVTVEFSTPRFKALSYYLEKEGKSIEGELQKKLQEMYRGSGAQGGTGVCQGTEPR